MRILRRSLRERRERGVNDFLYCLIMMRCWISSMMDTSSYGWRLSVVALLYDASYLHLCCSLLQLW